MTLKACSVEGCDRVAKARGLCQNHYSQWRFANVPAARERRRAAGREYAKRRWATDPEYRARRKAQSQLYTARFHVVSGVLVEVPNDGSATNGSKGRDGADAPSPSPAPNVRATRGLPDQHGGSSG